MAVNSEVQFGAWLKQLRARRALTQAELAQRVGYAGPTLQKIERGVTRPSRPMAERLADVLALPADEREQFLSLAAITSAVPASRVPLVDETAGPLRRRVAVMPPTVTLIGREADQAELLTHLRAPERRLITLVGPGGIGKTSLALQVASDLARDSAELFADGVVAVYLAGVASSSDVVLAIAEAYGQQVPGGRPMVDQLLDALADRSLLLVLDNVEHLLPPPHGDALIDLLEQLLARAPGVRLLLTSRERLRLRDEWVMEVTGLELPAMDTGARVERADAVRLFLERARRGAPGLTLDAESRAAVVRICRRLEGMPLAIELAAAWARTLSPAEIAAEMDRALDFLTLTDRNAPARHRTLRGTLSYSWDLLEQDERTTLARLSVFSGGCDREAAMSITGATLPVLTALIDKSLLRRADVDGVTRYSLHELVRQYAAERLQAEPEDETATVERHLSYFAALMRQLLDPNTAASTPAGRATLERNMDNLRSAWVRAAQHKNFSALEAMSRVFWILYDSHGWLLDGAELFGQATAALRGMQGDAAAVRGHILGLQSYFLQRANRLELSLPIVEEGLALLQAARGLDGRSELLYFRGMIRFHLADTEGARSDFTEALELSKGGQDVFRRLWTEIWLGVVSLVDGDYDDGDRLLTSFYQAWRGSNYHRGEAVGLAGLGEVKRLTGQPQEALALLRQGLQIAGTAGDTLAIGMCLCQLGALALQRGEWDEARYLLSESYDLMHEIGDAWQSGRSLTYLHRAEQARGDLRAAQRVCAELTRIVVDGERIMTVDTAYGFALLLERTGSYVEALALLLAAEPTPCEFSTAQLARELRDTLARRLSESERASARAMSRERSLHPWLLELAGRTFTPAAAPSAPAAPAPAPGAGSAFVPATGETLSPREVEVLRLIIAGAGNQAIADTLVISLHTAKHHVANILQKLGVATRTQAAAQGRSLGLEPLSPQ